MGTWIEISVNGEFQFVSASFPSWERGLKSLTGFLHLCRCLVVPLVGTWIEISKYIYHFLMNKVVPLVGTWIEIWEQV